MYIIPQFPINVKGESKPCLYTRSRMSFKARRYDTSVFVWVTRLMLLWCVGNASVENLNGFYTNNISTKEKSHL